MVADIEDQDAFVIIDDISEIDPSKSTAPRVVAHFGTSDFNNAQQNSEEE